MFYFCCGDSASEESVNCLRLCGLLYYRQDFFHIVWLEILETSLKPSLGMHPSRACVCHLFEKVYWFLLKSSPLCLSPILQHICGAVSKSWSGAPPSIYQWYGRLQRTLHVFILRNPLNLLLHSVSTWIQARQTPVPLGSPSKSHLETNILLLSIPREKMVVGDFQSNAPWFGGRWGHSDEREQGVSQTSYQASMPLALCLPGV